MRRTVLLLLSLLLVSSSFARAEATDPGDLFVNAYMAVQEGDKAEQAGKLKEAMSKFRYAAQILDQISTRNPTWQPSILEYRKKRTSEALTRLQEKIGRFGPGKEEPMPIAEAPPGEAAPLVPGDSPILFPDNLASASAAPVRKPTRSATDRKAPEPDLPSSNPIREIEDRMAKLTRELEEARSTAEKAKKERSEVAKQLEEATKAREASVKKQQILEQRAAAAEDALLRAKTDSEETKKFQAELTDVRKQLRNLKYDAEADAEIRTQLEDRLRSAQTKISRLNEEKAAAQQLNAEAPGRIGEIQKQLDSARKEKNDLVTRLTKTETDLKVAVAQRDEALGQVARMKEAQKQVDKLIADNASLMAKLGEAEKTIMDFRADGTRKDAEIASLRKETTSLKEQLAQAQKDSATYQQQMNDLQQKLTTANGQIAQMKADTTRSAAERNRLADENKMLRGIVLRQQASEARRAQTKKLVLGELAKLENKSKVLMDQIEYLSGPVQQLSEKERALFKKPELQISDTEISLSAVRPQEASTEPALPQSDAPIASATSTATPSTLAGPSKNASESAADGPKVTTPTAADAQSASAPEKPVTGAGEKKMAQSAPATPVGANIKAPAPLSTPKPNLSLSADPADTMSLAKNTSPFSTLPDLPTKGSESPSTKPGTEQAPPDKSPAVPGTASGTPGAAPETSAPATGTPGTGFGTPGSARTAEPLSSGDATAAGASGTANLGTAAMNLPADLVPLAREGKDHFERGNYREAEKTYERILTKAPNNLYTLSNLGVVYFRGGKLKRAEEMFRKAIAIAPEDGFSHCTLGIVYYSQQKYDEAVNELTKALAINPKNATAHNYLGITASQKGWQEAALKELETATTLDPTYADAHFNLAVVFATQAPPNKESARRFYRRSTELGAEPDSALEQLIK